MSQETPAYDAEEITRQAALDLVGTWLSSADGLPDPDQEGHLQEILGSAGEGHPLRTLMHTLRGAMLELGFNEVELPLVASEEELIREMGPLGRVMNHEVYYLASSAENRFLPMDDFVPLEQLPAELRESLEKLLISYNRSPEGISSLLEKLLELGLEEGPALDLMAQLAPPAPTRVLPSKHQVRSHFFLSWLPTLSSLQFRWDRPLRAFSTNLTLANRGGTWLPVNHFSVAILGQSVNYRSGEELAELLLARSGYETSRVEPSVAVFPFAPSRMGVITVNDRQVGVVGLLSPVVLARHSITATCLMLNFDLNALMLQLQSTEESVERVLFPQFAQTWGLSDQELSGTIQYMRRPQTEEGVEAVRRIVATCRRYGNERSPCRFLAFSGKLEGHEVQIFCENMEDRGRLCGPAHLAEVIVDDGNILGLPHTPLYEETFQNGTPTELTFLEAYANWAVRDIEQALREDPAEEIPFTVGEIVQPADINMIVEPFAQRYIRSKNRKVALKGTLATTVICRMKEGK